VYIVLSGFSLAKCILIRIFATPSDMGDGLIPVSKRSNWTSFMIHLAYEMYVDHGNYLYHKLIDNICMISIGYTHMMLNTLIWLKLD
jgi:hypothetical protein